MSISIAHDLEIFIFKMILENKYALDALTSQRKHIQEGKKLRIIRICPFPSAVVGTSWKDSWINMVDDYE